MKSTHLFVHVRKLTAFAVLALLGPGLVPFGIDHVLADPVLTVFRGPTIVAMNDNWDASTTSAEQSRAGAAPLAIGSGDAVITAVLPPGNYTAQVTARSGSAGNVLVEIFELP